MIRLDVRVERIRLAALLRTDHKGPGEKPMYQLGGHCSQARDDVPYTRVAAVEAVRSGWILGVLWR